MTKDDALKMARDLLSKRLELPRNDETAEIVAGALLVAYDKGVEAGIEVEKDSHFCEPCTAGHV